MTGPAEKREPTWLWPSVIGAIVLVLVAIALIRGGRPGEEPIVVDTTGPDTTVAVDSTPRDTVADEEAWREDEEWPPADQEAVDTLVSLAPPPRGAAPRAAASMMGLPVGPSAWPEDKWCSGFITATTESMNLKYWKPGMADADACNIRLVSTIPRKYYTTNGENVGRFDMAKAKATIDRSAAALAALPVSQRDNLLYVSILDDMGCDSCWPPDGISPAQTAELTRYARSKFPSWVAVGLRVDPQWMARSGITNWGVDVSVMQWHRRKGPKNLTGTAKQRAWYLEGVGVAPRVGVKRIVFAVNILKCEGGGNDAQDTPCSPTEMQTHLSLAIETAPTYNCGSLNWRWDESTWSQAYQDAWRRVVALGNSKPKQLCK